MATPPRLLLMKLVIAVAVLLSLGVARGESATGQPHCLKYFRPCGDACIPRKHLCQLAYQSGFPAHQSKPKRAAFVVGATRGSAAPPIAVAGRHQALLCRPATLGEKHRCRD